MRLSVRFLPTIAECNNSSDDERAYNFPFMSFIGRVCRISVVVLSAWVVLLAVYVGYFGESILSIPTSYKTTDCTVNEVSAVHRELAHPEVPFKCGSVELFDSSDLEVRAYVQPDGGTCWSNGGFIRSGHKLIMVDALQDVTLTRNMVESSTDMGEVNTFILTHPDIDHFGGILEVPANATAVMREEMVPVVDATFKVAPASFNKLIFAYHAYEWLGKFLVPYVKWLPAKTQGVLGLLKNGHYLAKFDPTMPEKFPLETRTFKTDVYRVNDDVMVKCFGPIHSKHDCTVLVPKAKVVFTGDLLFIGVTPIMWAGPVEKWLEALSWLEQQVDDSWKLVPGHGPVTSLKGLKALDRYWKFFRDQMAADGCNCVSTGESCGTELFEKLPEEFREWVSPERMRINGYVHCEVEDSSVITVDTKIRLLAQAEALRMRSEASSAR
ncbi:hypothetical protein FOZ63_029227 [Perkinsus olseni]|uniref:Metallo-beta-lactamase domain-containing protein n=1 Tax=Perkinsus olseni TaxID=32597 RepID=A0A7J6UJE5_PEROL|nr:hypothetical protein FOZ62_027476 [Perkinsus olseni]KAF4757364.1 hypothetical protein FOZ63_029227 [Perkinsus olseni]